MLAILRSQAVQRQRTCPSTHTEAKIETVRLLPAGDYHAALVLTLCHAPKKNCVGFVTLAEVATLSSASQDGFEVIQYQQTTLLAHDGQQA